MEKNDSQIEKGLMRNLFPSEASLKKKPNPMSIFQDNKGLERRIFWTIGRLFFPKESSEEKQLKNWKRKLKHRYLYRFFSEVVFFFFDNTLN